jgi:hypothetical protein
LIEPRQMMGASGLTLDAKDMEVWQPKQHS